jgi:hypothetical protein
MTTAGTIIEKATKRLSWAIWRSTRMVTEDVWLSMMFSPAKIGKDSTQRS